MGGREIIDCDLCNAHWHLDCMDPPLAKHRKSKTKTNWTCPIHVELFMSRTYAPKQFGKTPARRDVTFTGKPYKNVLDLHAATSLLPPTPNKALPELSDPGREIQIRRPKNWKPSETIHRRGFENDGIIAVENEPSDGEEEIESPGVVTRVPEKGIKLDFIDRIKK